MPVIHFIGGEKGGVGKSVVARLLAQYYIDHDKAFQAYDADQSHGAMMRYYADFAEAVDPNDFESLDRIAETAANTGDDVIVDLAAQTSRQLYRWIEECGMTGMAGELGITIKMWHVMDDGSDSLRLLDELLDSYGDAVKYVVVRNHGRGKSFDAFNSSDVHRRALKGGAMFIDLPGLAPSTMRKIDHLNVSFWAAANRTEGVGMMDRQRSKVWLRKAFTQIGLALVSK